MRILLGLVIVAICATPAFAGNKSKHEKNVAKLEAALNETFKGPGEPDRRQEIDKLERKLAFELFKLQQQ